MRSMDSRIYRYQGTDKTTLTFDQTRARFNDPAYRESQRRGTWLISP